MSLDRTSPRPWSTTPCEPGEVECNIVSANGHVVARGIYHEDAELIVSRVNAGHVEPMPVQHAKLVQ